MIKKFLTTAKYMKKEWISFFIMEVILVGLKLLWNFSNISFIISKNFMVVGFEIFAGIFLVSMGMNYMQKLQSINNVCPMNPLMKNISNIGYIIISTLFVTGIEVISIICLVYNKKRISLTRYLSYFFDHTLRPRENVFSYFMGEFIFFAICIIYGCLLGYLINKFGRKVIALIILAILLFILPYGSFRLTRGSDSSKNISRITENLCMGYERARACTKYEDFADNFYYISEEEMDQALGNIQIANVNFSLPYENELIPYSEDEYSYYPKNLPVEYKHLFYDSSNNWMLQHKSITLSFMWSVINYSNMTLGNGLDTTLTAKELEKKLGNDGHPIEYDLLDDSKHHYIEYIITDGNNRFITYKYRIYQNTDIERNGNNTPLIVELDINPLYLFMEI